ncbi:DNA invertase Pin-like site-specific DNA recombinase [Bradyrhizobium elkanii]|nr:DNA invertase Pin-like site-specific DNA recombinase [Bradyrhizobium elkanii]MCS3966819.1 DNA invertase Pin-like site-specific DNA recombinase [Bradyrhizobium japonicum]
MVELRTAGCERVFCEKESGAKDERRELKRLLKTLRAGDATA